MSLQIEHKTEKGTLCFVKVPDDANCFTMEFGRLCFNDVGNMPDYIILNKYGLTPERGQEDDEFWELASKHQEEQNRIDNFQLIGLTSEVTEEQAKMMLPKHIEKNTNFGIQYGYMYSTKDTEIYISALDAWHALMQFEKVYEVNPYPKFYVNKMTGKKSARLDWEQTESRIGKWIVLFKPND